MTSWPALAVAGLLLAPLPSQPAPPGADAFCSASEGPRIRSAPTVSARGDSVVLERLEVKVLGRPVGLEVEGYQAHGRVGDTLHLTYWPTIPGGARTAGLVSWGVAGCDDVLSVTETSDTTALIVLLRPGRHVLVAEVRPVDFLRVGAIGVTGPGVPPGEFVWDSWPMQGDPEAWLDDDGVPVSDGEVVRLCAFAFQEGDPPRPVGASSRECLDAAFPDLAAEDVVRSQAMRSLLGRVAATP